MNFLEFKKRINLLNEIEKNFMYTLSLEDAINFLKTIW